MIKFKIFIIFIFFLLPFQGLLAQVENIGIIPSNIWYSKDPFFENDKIKIYTVVFNSDKRELSGTVIFFDNNTLLGKKDFKVAPNRTTDVSIDWTVSAGEHIIFAKIENTKFLISKDKYEEVYLTENKTIESKKNVSKQIILKDSSNDIINSIAESDTFSNIQKVVAENTPPFVTKAIDTTINTLEKTRQSGITISNKEKDSVQKKIDILNNLDSSKEKISDESTKNFVLKEKLKAIKEDNYRSILKPFNYIKLFMFNLFIFVCKSKILFYGILAIVLFTILRFLWRLVF